MEFREVTLPNGLEIVAECNLRAYSTAFAFFVNTGSRDETDEIAGVSHFLEHMTFKGTPHRSAEDVNRELDELGSHANAYTSEEHTVYYATVLPEYQGATLNLLADIMRPSLRQEDFDTEKQVILEEILKDEDQPPFGAHEKCMAAYFEGHPLGNSILGTTESVSNLSSRAMNEYFRQRYSPGNMKLVAAGNVDFDRLVEDAKRECGSWEAIRTHRSEPAALPRQAFRVIAKENAAQQYIIQIAAGPSTEDEDRHTAQILAAIAGDDSGSRLYWELVDTGLAEYAGMGAYEFQNAGVLMSYVCCAPEQAADNLQRVASVYEQLERDGITADELELARNKICSNLVRQSERSSNRLFSIGNDWLQRRRYQTIQEQLVSYQSVDLATVNQLLEKYPLTRNTTVAVGPLEQLHGPTASKIG